MPNAPARATARASAPPACGAIGAFKIGYLTPRSAVSAVRTLLSSRARRENRFARLLPGKACRVVNQETKRCDNLACLCEIPSPASACSPYCEGPDGRDPHAILCRCDHAPCKEESDIQLAGGAGRESPG